MSCTCLFMAAFGLKIITSSMAIYKESSSVDRDGTPKEMFGSVDKDAALAASLAALEGADEVELEKAYVVENIVNYGRF